MSPAKKAFPVTAFDFYGLTSGLPSGNGGISGASYWAREFRKCGHEVRLIAPQFVKPYVKPNKNDAADAEAICEALQRPNMRFVAPKSIEQQDVPSLHRIRSRRIAARTSLCNEIRGLLTEYRVILPQGLNQLRKNQIHELEKALNDQKIGW
jgi:transposase